MQNKETHEVNQSKGSLVEQVNDVEENGGEGEDLSDEPGDSNEDNLPVEELTFPAVVPVKEIELDNFEKTLYVGETLSLTSGDTKGWRKPVEFDICGNIYVQ